MARAVAVVLIRAHCRRPDGRFSTGRSLTKALCQIELVLDKQSELRIVYFEEGCYTQFPHFRFTKSLTWKPKVTQLPN
jgi:hypothetical protein